MTSRRVLPVVANLLFWYSFSTPAEIPAQCNTVYAIHDEGQADSQFFTYSLLHNQLTPLGPLYQTFDLEGLALHPQTHILYASSGQPHAFLYTLNGLSGELTPIGPLGFDHVVALAFHPEGSLWGWAKQGLLRIDPETGSSTLMSAPFSSSSVQGLAWHPQGTLLYAVAPDTPTQSTLWTYDDHYWQRACEDLPPKVEALEFRPDGFLLYGFHQDQQLGIHLYDPTTCRPVITNWLTTPYNDLEGIVWPVCPTHQELLKTYLEQLPGVEQVTFQSDGTLLVTRLGEVYWGKLDPTLHPGSPTGQVIMEETDDLNGDGFKDFQVTYPDGDRQRIDYFGKKTVQPPPTLSLNHIQTLKPGETLQISVTSNVPWVSFLLTVNQQALTVDAQGHAALTLSLPGVYTLDAQMTDATGRSAHTESTFIVTAPQDKTPPVVAMKSPALNSEITAPGIFNELKKEAQQTGFQNVGLSSSAQPTFKF